MATSVVQPVSTTSASAIMVASSVPIAVDKASTAGSATTAARATDSSLELSRHKPMEQATTSAEGAAATASPWAYSLP